MGYRFQDLFKRKKKKQNSPDSSSASVSIALRLCEERTRRTFRLALLWHLNIYT